LARKYADLNFSLLQPASMFRREVDGIPAPDFAADFVAEKVRELLAPMDIELVNNQVTRLGPIIQ
jgi:hypothetical protein